MYRIAVLSQHQRTSAVSIYEETCSRLLGSNGDRFPHKSISPRRASQRQRVYRDNNPKKTGWATWDFMQIIGLVIFFVSLALLTLRNTSSDRKGHPQRLVGCFCGRRLLIAFRCSRVNEPCLGTHILFNFLNRHKQFPQKNDISIASLYYSTTQLVVKLKSLLKWSFQER
jgi:hypothetical protein